MPQPWFDPGFTSEDWKEAVAMYSPTQLSMGRKRSHATLTGYIPFEKIAGAVKYFLGISWVDENNFLRREIPATHPIFPTLFATEISECVGVKFITKVAKPHKWSLPYASYTLARITVAYSQPPYQILADNDIIQSPTNYPAYRGEEFKRWCYWHPKSYVDQLELPGGFLVFHAPGVQINGNDLDGRPLIAPRLVYRAEKQLRKLVWYNVPQEFVMNPLGFMPKIEAAIGKINSQIFFGDPNMPAGSPGNPHTWLLEDVDTVNSEVYADPIASAAFGDLTRRLDIIFYLKHFNPPNGLPGSTEAGWRLNLAADGKWYPGRNNATNALQDIPAETNFAQLVTHWSDV